MWESRFNWDRRVCKWGTNVYHFVPIPFKKCVVMKIWNTWFISGCGGIQNVHQPMVGYTGECHLETQQLNNFDSYHISNCSAANGFDIGASGNGLRSQFFKCWVRVEQQAETCRKHLWMRVVYIPRSCGNIPMENDDPGCCPKTISWENSGFNGDGFNGQLRSIISIISKLCTFHDLFTRWQHIGTWNVHCMVHSGRKQVRKTGDGRAIGGVVGCHRWSGLG